MEIEIENIIVKSNPRTDFGDLDELTASIKEKGILEPLLVRPIDNNKVELVAGERRLRAAKAAGLERVPVAQYSGVDIDIEEVKLIENMHRKDLNPVEEAKAFRQYLDTTKSSIENLAQKISKPKIYIERRLELLTLPEQVTKPLAEGKILLGHALIIARLKDKKSQKATLKEIIRDKMSVKQAETQVKYNDNTIRLQYAVFDKSECKGCRYNGGEQSILFETGSELKGLCLDKKCYFKKTKDWKTEKTQKLQKQGINILSPASINALKVKEKVQTWDDDYKKILKKLPKEPENYAVVFDEGYQGNPQKQIYCLNPKARRPEQAKEKIKAKATTSKEKLRNKVQDFKREFLIAKTQELMQPGTKETKAIALFALLNEGISWNDRNRRDATEQLLKTEKIGKSSFGGIDPVFSKILELEEKEIDRLTNHASSLWVKNLSDDLSKAATEVGVDLTEHFAITEDYLKLHRKDQLITLAKEIKLDKHLKKNGIQKWEKAKRTELVSYFLNNGFELKGVVPKLMIK